MSSPQTKVTRFFYWCSGACPDVLEGMPPQERTKYFCLGGAICTTWTFATIAGFFALELIFPQYLLPQCLFAIVWGLIIFNIDRLIAISLTKSVNPNDFGADHFFNFIKNLAQASPRILMAIIIGFVISKPLELRIFKVEITANMKKLQKEVLASEKLMLNLEHEQKLENFENEKKELIKRIEKIDVRLFSLRQQFISEADGTVGTKKVGIGGIAKIKEDTYLNAEKKQTPKQKKLETRVENLDKLIENERKAILNRIKEAEHSISNTFSNGLLARLKALYNLTSNDNIAYWTDLAVFTLILIIEMLPIIVKLFSPVGPYDFYISDANKKKIEEITLNKS